MRRWMPGMFAVLLGADEVMKQYVEDYMEPGEERRIAGGKLLLRRIHNPGFALGTLEDQPKIVRNVSVAAAVPVFAWWLSLIWRKGHWIEKTGSTLAAAGAAREPAGPAASRKSGRLYWFSDQVFLLFQADCKPGRPVSGGRVASYGSAKNSLI